MTHTELLPCPMCGQKHDWTLNAHGFNRFSVECCYCGLNTSQKVGKEGAIAAWNARAFDVQGLIEKLNAVEKEEPGQHPRFLAGIRQGISEIHHCATPESDRSNTGQKQESIIPVEPPQDVVEKVAAAISQARQGIIIEGGYIDEAKAAIAAYRDTL